MINIDNLNQLIEFSGFFVALSSLILMCYAGFKISNYKEYKSLEQIKSDRLIELYRLHIQLARARTITRQNRILTKIDNLEKDIILIDKINWGLDYEEENSK